MLGKSHQETEIVLNLWAYSDEQGYIRRIAGKCYGLQGSDEEKLQTLRILSAADYITTRWHPVPEHCQVVGAEGKAVSGIAATTELLNPMAHESLFRELINELEADLPEQVVCHGGAQYKGFRASIPQEPLVITTVVIEQKDGLLIPVLKSRK